MRHEKAGLLLDLARRLAASAEGLTLDEMAQAIGVGRRTVERMRDALWDLFPNLEEVEDPPSKRFRITGGLDRLFQNPTTEELVELGKAAEALRGADAPARAEALSSLEAKIRSAMRGAALRRVGPDVEALMRAETIAVQAGPRPFEDEATIAAIRTAIMALQALGFRYDGGSRPGERRAVTPFGIMFGHNNYLVAAELGSEAPRTFRLDRIADLELLDIPAAPPEGFDLQDFAHRSFGIYQGGGQEDVALRIAPGRAEDALRWRFHPSQTTEPQADGSVIVRFTASGMLELAWHLFSWGASVRVLAPESLRQLMIEELGRALTAHGADA
ncbi:MAG TPA: WYL domain-containing protein [Caulobacteraceae bacterium]|jgi:predicted DNA-binding transcriptional regulator YafY